MMSDLGDLFATGYGSVLDANPPYSFSELRLANNETHPAYFQQSGDLLPDLSSFICSSSGFGTAGSNALASREQSPRLRHLNAHWFLTLDDAQKMEDWRIEHNKVCPHGAIGNKPPISLKKGSSAASAE